MAEELLDRTNHPLPEKQSDGISGGAIQETMMGGPRMNTWS